MLGELRLLIGTVRLEVKIYYKKIVEKMQKVLDIDTFLSLSQLRICRPPPSLRSVNLDIKSAQCAENKDCRKLSYNIISCFGAAGG